MTSTLKERIDSFWVEPPSSTSTTPEPKPLRYDAYGAIMAWPAAILIIVHRLAVLAVNGAVTDDFGTVYQALRRFWEHQPVYGETYYFVDPHYLYNPGATVVLSPLALIDNVELARMLFVALNALCIIIALALLIRMLGFRMKGAVFPLVLAVAFLTEAVTNTLVFGNINGVLLCALVGYLHCLVAGRTVSAGIIIGLAIVIKPVFLPLLFLPLVMLAWKTLLLGIAIPVVANLVAWPVVPGASDYVHRTAPYLAEVRDYANSSLPGFVAYFQLPEAINTLLFIVFAVLVLIGVVFLARIRINDPVVWVCATSGLLLAGAFLLSSLGQMYYSMMLFPLLLSVVRPLSPMRSAAAWTGAFLCLSPLEWSFVDWPVYGRWLTTFQATAGWGLLVLAVALYSVRAYRRAR